MKIRRNKSRNSSKPHPDQAVLNFGQQNQTRVRAVSSWKIFALFLVVNLVIINLINYWQPVNHSNLKLAYNKQQELLLSAYDLQHAYNKFKTHPDKNAFSLIQQTVSLNTKLHTIKQYQPDYNLISAKKLNDNIENIISETPSIKLFNESIDKNYRLIKNLKYKIVASIADNNSLKLSKNISIDGVYKIADNIENLLQQLKFNQWYSYDISGKFQQGVETIGLELEQIDAGDIKTNTGLLNVISNIEEVFNDLNSLMPTIFDLSKLSSELKLAELNQAAIIDEIQAHNVNVIDRIDDKTIIIITLVFANLLLFVLIFFAKTTEKIKTIYHNFKHREEVYYLSHEENATSQINDNIEVAENKATYSQDDIDDLKHQLLHPTSIMNKQAADKVVVIKEKIVSDCYILLNNIDRMESLLKNLPDSPSNMLIIIHKITYQIIDQAMQLDQNIKLLLSDSKSAEQRHENFQQVDSNTKVDSNEKLTEV